MNATNLWEGSAPMDDAGAIYLSDDTLLFQSVDIMTPTCDDPHLFGRIAAANAMSDLFARGAKPISALHILAYPPDKVDASVAASILNGASEVLATVGAAILGGHTLTDNDVKYGLAVSGIASVDAVIPMKGAQPGDILVLTKPIGTGVVIDYLKKHSSDHEDIQRIWSWMAQTNAISSQGMVKAKAHAATDITGYGLLGHGLHLAQASGVKIHISAGRVPVYKYSAELFRKGHTAGAHKKNLRFVRERVRFEMPESRAKRWAGVLADPQTSGGLLIAMDESAFAAFEAWMKDHNAPFWVIGKVIEKGEPEIRVTTTRDLDGMVVV